MVVRQETHPGTGAGAGPPEFREAVASMHAARLRPEVFCEEMPAPQRIAPYAAALSADVTVDGTDVGTGRIILLHDPPATTPGTAPSGAWPTPAPRSTSS